MRVAINGFGRIGRNFMRCWLGRQNSLIDLVAINDTSDPRTNAHLLRYDSMLGKMDESVQIDADDNSLTVNGKVVKCTSDRNPENLPWKELGIDLIIESTGVFVSKEGASKHLKAGAKKVLITAPGKGDDGTFVVGVNHLDYDHVKHNIISNASCTTNCLAPIAKVLHQNFGITEGLMTTVHSMTATQPTVDGPSKKDWRGGRGASQNIIPSSTGAAKAVALVLPDLKGKLTGMAFRVGTPNVSVVDLTFKTAKATSHKEICEAMKAAADGDMKGILGYTDEELVSMDFRTDSRSSIFDAKASMELNSNFFKAISWYDNEWGYSCRVVDLMVDMAKKEGLV